MLRRGGIMAGARLTVLVWEGVTPRQPRVPAHLEASGAVSLPAAAKATLEQIDEAIRDLC